MRLAPTRRLVYALLAGGLGPLLLAPLGTTFIALGFAADVILLVLWGLEGRWLLGHATLEVTRRVSATLPQLVPATVTLAITNPSDEPLTLRVRDGIPERLVGARELPVELRTVVPAHSSRALEYTITPSARGTLAFGDVGLWIETRLGLAARRLDLPMAQTVQVVPDLALVKGFDAMVRRRQLNLLGVRLVRKLGAGRDFDRLRDYEPDDDYRHLNWSATARRGRPTSNVYQVERGQDILIAVDASRMMGLAADGRTKLDHAIMAALLVARAALEHEDNVGLAIYSASVETFLPPRRGKAQIGRIAKLLVPIEPRSTVVSFRRTFQFLATRCRRRALVILFTDLLDEDHARDLLAHLPLIRRRHLPLLVTLADQGITDLTRRTPRTEAEVYETVVAEELASERAALVHALERKGALVVDAPAAELGPRTITSYLRVKAEQLL